MRKLKDNGDHFACRSRYIDAVNQNGGGKHGTHTLLPHFRQVNFSLFLPRSVGKSLGDSKMFEVGIVGGGISGLYVALQLSRMRKKVVLCDDRTYTGGRVRTHRSPQYEIGAERFTKHHKILNTLIAHYGLQTHAIPSHTEYFDANELVYKHDKIKHFENCMKIVLRASNRYTKENLYNMTFYDLCSSVLVDDQVDELVSIFGYRCEFEYLNAYDGCRTFSEDFSGHQFFTLRDGMSAICECMKTEICNNGGIVHLNTKVTNVNNNPKGFSIQTKQLTIACKKIVFAVKPHQMKQFSPLASIRYMLSSVRAGQLLRIYARFPLINGKPWFSGMKRTTTDSFIRQVIPISEQTGLIMISYTDGADVDMFLHKNGKVRDDVQRIVVSECRRLFTKTFGTIPNPTYFKAHYWSHGCHYWQTGVDSQHISNALINPVHNVYTCGEGFSMKQCWMEGALRSAKQVIQTIQAPRGCVLL